MCHKNLPPSPEGIFSDERFKVPNEIPRSSVLAPKSSKSSLASFCTTGDDSDFMQNSSSPQIIDVPKTKKKKLHIYLIMIMCRVFTVHHTKVRV